MARRTKAWWAALTALERCELSWLDKAAKHGGPRMRCLPKRRMCGYCLDIIPEEHNLCSSCNATRQAIIAKANKAQETPDDSPD